MFRPAGTLCIDGSRSSSTSRAADEMQRLPGDNITVLLFPEGTSSDGSAALRFHPSLFDPAVVAGMPVTSSAASCASEDGSPENVPCCYGDDTFGLTSFALWALVRFQGTSISRQRRNGILIAKRQPPHVGGRSRSCEKRVLEWELRLP